jgi:hypothetical protein
MNSEADFDLVLSNGVVLNIAFRQFIRADSVYHQAFFLADLVNSKLTIFIYEILLQLK